MSKFQRCGVQKEPAQSGIRQLFIELTIAIAVVKGNRMSGILRMHANLVRSSSHGTAAHKRSERVTLFHFKARFRWLAFLIHPNDTLAALQNVL